MSSQPLDILSAGLRGAAARQSASALNIANSNTPGYRAQKARFGEEFQQALDRGDREGAANLQPRLEDREGVPNASGNDVDLDNEVLELHRAGADHKGIARLIDLSLQRLRLAIGGA